MLTTTLAVLCWMGVAAADPTAPAASSVPAQARSSSPHQTRASGASIEIELEICEGLGSLGRSIIAAIGSETDGGLTISPTCQVGGMANSVCSPCVSGSCREMAGGLIQAGFIDRATNACEAWICPVASGAQTSNSCCCENESCTCHTCAVCGSVTAVCRENAAQADEGACHVRDMGVVQLRHRPMHNVFDHPSEQTIPYHSVSQSWVFSQPEIGGHVFRSFVSPVPARAPQIYVASPAPPHPQWIHHPGEGPSEGPGDVRGRIDHMHEAARHLDAAGMHGEAHDLRHRAEEMEHQARRLLEEKEAQIRQLQQEIEALRGVIHHDESQASIAIPAMIFRASPEALAVIREHCRSAGSVPVNRAEFQQLIERLHQAGLVEMISRPQVMALCGSQATIQFQVPCDRSHDGQHDSSCSLMIRPELHDGCCRLELHPQLRTATPMGIQLQSSRLTVDLDPSQGIVTEVAADGSLLAFVTWNAIQSRQPTAAMPPTVSSQNVRPASAELRHSGDAVPNVCTPHSLQIHVVPLLPQPFPARVPQSPSALELPPSPIPSAELAPSAVSPRR